MITQYILAFFLGIIEMLINLIPDMTLPTDFMGLMSDVTFLVAQTSYILPLRTIGICLSVIFVLQNASFIISIFNFIIRKIPGLN